MLFRTVYGAELEPVFSFVNRSDKPVIPEMVYEAFIPNSKTNLTASTKNIDDALSFLESAYLIHAIDGKYKTKQLEDLPFRLKLLQNMRRISKHELNSIVASDWIYMFLLEHIFIGKNQLYILDLHTEANKLSDVAAIGGLSKEKIQAWKRIMAFIGIGYRIGSGFQCVYTPKLLREILQIWPSKEGALQDFFEGHLEKFLPIQTEDGNLPIALEQSLLYLEKNKEIELQPRQDLPSKPYFGDLRYRHLKVQVVDL